MPRFQLICVPDWLGSTRRTGVELGPKRLADTIMQSPLVGFFHAAPSHIDVPLPNDHHLTGIHARTKYLPEVRALCINVKDRVRETVASGRVPVVLIGNDSSMLGVLLGLDSARAGQDFGIVYFDAHGDINTPETSPSGCLYGMPLAHALGFGHPRLVSLGNGAPLSPERFVIVGVRNLDAGEAAIIRHLNICCFPAERIQAYSGRDLAAHIVEYFVRRYLVAFHIHIDLDVLDPEESPGVSMKEAGGIAGGTLLATVSSLCRSGLQVVGASISEYNPKQDQNDKTMKIAQDLIGVVLENDPAFASKHPAAW